MSKCSIRTVQLSKILGGEGSTLTIFTSSRSTMFFCISHGPLLGSGPSLKAVRFRNKEFLEDTCMSESRLFLQFVCLSRNNTAKWGLFTFSSGDFYILCRYCHGNKCIIIVGVTWGERVMYCLLNG